MAIILLLLPLSGWAQQGNWQDQPSSGAIEEQVLVLEKELDLTLPVLDRPYAPIGDTPPPPLDRSQSYTFADFDFALPPLQPNVRAVKQARERLRQGFGNYARAGFGSSLSALGEVQISNTTRQGSVFARARHFSMNRGPVDGSSSAASTTELDLGADYAKGDFSMEGEAWYSRQGQRYYGYFQGLDPLPEGDSLRQVWHNLGVGARLHKAPGRSNVTLDGRLKLDTWTPRQGPSEQQVHAGVAGSLPLLDSLELMVDLDAALLMYANGSAIDRSLWRFSPRVAFHYEGFDLEVGIRYALEANFGSTQSHLYPLAEASYEFAEELTLAAWVRGDLQLNSIGGFAQVNPWIAFDDLTSLANTNERLTLGGELRGNLAGNFSYRAGANLSSLRYLPTYALGAADSTQFTYLLDSGAVTRLSIHGLVSYHYQQRYITTLQGRVFAYDMNQLAEAWHLPNVELSWFQEYGIQQKLFLSSTLSYISGIKGLNLASGEQTDLNPIVDVSAKVRYAFSPQAHAFIEGRNLIGQEYERWWNYPNQGVLVLGGLTYYF